MGDDRVAAGAIDHDALRHPWREAAWVALYGLAWLLGYYVSTDYWFLPAGIRFASLWTAPRRLWPWLALSEFAAILVIVLQGEGYRTWSGFALGVVVPWLLHAAVVSVARRGDAAPTLPDTPWRMGRLLIAMLIATAATACVLTLMSRIEEGPALLDPTLRLLHFAIGDFIALLIVVPIWLQLRTREAAPSRRMLIELLLFFLPLLALVLLVPALRPRAVLYASLLALVPMVVIAFRHGWQGAAWSLAGTSVALYVVDRVLHQTVSREVMQLFLSIVGAVTLGLGAAVVALRRARDELSARNAELARQALELRALGARLVRAQEDEQRRIAQELQGELEQGLTALGTRLGLLTRTSLEPAQMAAVDSLRSLSQDIQSAMRDVLVHLRPAVLDRYGLEQALRAGPIRDLLDDAGVSYRVMLTGTFETLDPETQGALYRICQEAAIDCVRRQRGRRFALRLELADAGDALALDLEIDYDSDPTQARSAGDAGLPGTRDRVVALGGEYDASQQGVELRHRVRVSVPRRVPPGAP